LIWNDPASPNLGLVVFSFVASALLLSCSVNREVNESEVEVGFVDG
jgi:hypothetical protein